MARDKLIHLEGGPWEGQLRMVSKDTARAGELSMKSRTKGEARYVATGRKSIQQPTAEVWIHREERQPHG